MFDPPWEGARKGRSVNLSTTTSNSSTALLSSVRAERLARERARRVERAAIIFQAAWRGRDVRRQCKKELLESLENGKIPSVEARGRALVVLMRGGVKNDEDGRKGGKVLEIWSIMGREIDHGELEHGRRRM